MTGDETAIMATIIVTIIVTIIATIIGMTVGTSIDATVNMTVTSATTDTEKTAPGNRATACKRVMTLLRVVLSAITTKSPTYRNKVRLRSNAPRLQP
jgi:Na+/H+-dicarboxylate symporter